MEVVGPDIFVTIYLVYGPFAYFQVFCYFNFRYVQVVFIRISAAIHSTWCIFEALWELWKLSNNLLVIFTWAST